ncbi:MAG TPA: hypothetical protein PLK31_20950, partial [Chloroflexota bacterium]|nr:hypothetical protein [Chloroflexota bacterium]
TLTQTTQSQPRHSFRRWWETRSRVARQTISLIVLLLLLAFAWEGLKFIGGDPWRPANNPFGIEHNPPFRFKIASDLNLPHLWKILEAFGRESRRNGPPLIQVLASAAVFTFREAFLGFAIGGLLGFALGAVFAHSHILERGLMPYVV